eukprot:UN18397
MMQKMRGYLAELKKHDDLNTLVLAADAYDVLYNTNSKDENLEQYNAWNNDKVYFNAENGCWPFTILQFDNRDR